MTQKKKVDVASSIFQRLLNQAQANKEDFNHLLNRYGMERFLYRLSISPYHEEFILKGASLFLVCSPKIIESPKMRIFWVMENQAQKD